MYYWTIIPVQSYTVLSFLVKAALFKKIYFNWLQRNKRDNIHSLDLVSCFWEFYKKPRYGEVYNTGGGRFSNCSVIEALNIVENKTKIKIKKILKQNRVGIIFGISQVWRNLKTLPKLEAKM